MLVNNTIVSSAEYLNEREKELLYDILSNYKVTTNEILKEGMLLVPCDFIDDKAMSSLYENVKYNNEDYLFADDKQVIYKGNIYAPLNPYVLETLEPYTPKVELEYGTLLDGNMYFIALQLQLWNVCQGCVLPMDLFRDDKRKWRKNTKVVLDRMGFKYTSKGGLISVF